MQYRQQRSVISTLTNDNSLLIGITGNINDENRSFRVICNVSFSQLSEIHINSNK